MNDAPDVNTTFVIREIGELEGKDYSGVILEGSHDAIRAVGSLFGERVVVRASLPMLGAGQEKEAKAVAWQSPETTPSTPLGSEEIYIVAVRRAHNGKVYTFPAAFLNAFPLRYEYECPKGDGCDGTGCDDGCPTTGWYSATGDGDDGTTYTIMHMDKGDEFLGWRPLPAWDTHPAPASTAVGEITEEMINQIADAVFIDGWGTDDANRLRSALEAASLASCRQVEGK